MSKVTIEDAVQATYESCSTTVHSLARQIQNNLGLTENETVKVVFLMSQMRLGYDLTIYAEENGSILPSPIVCVVSYEEELTKENQDLTFELRVENILTMAVMERKYIRMKEFAQIVKEYAPTREFGLHMDITFKK